MGTFDVEISSDRHRSRSGPDALCHYAWYWRLRSKYCTPQRKYQYKCSDCCDNSSVLRYPHDDNPAGIQSVVSLPKSLLHTGTLPNLQDMS